MVYDFETNEYTETIKHKVPSFFRDIRGSTNGVQRKDEIWLIAHLVSYEDRRYYYHILMALDATTYKIRRYTPLFTFEKEKVEYTLGFVYFQHNDTLLIGYSTNDNCTKYMTVNCDDIEFLSC